MNGQTHLSLLFCLWLCVATEAPADDLPAWPDAAQCAKRMTVPAAFQVRPFAAEPDVVNPIALDFDHRGRVFVLEALQYPIKATAGKKGADRIRILEDTDGDHIADRATVFADGLDLASGIAVGHGGVFVGQAPVLLFLEDTDGDDRADRRSVLLDGWSHVDTHATLNSLMFGPDGWLYGTQGIGNESTVRGQTFTASVWRYHPQTKAFQVFGHGTNNPWGLDYDEHGSFFLSTSVIPHLYHTIPHGFHRHPRGYTWANPYAYGEILTVVDHRHFPPSEFDGDHNDDGFGGGHAHAGLLIYQGGAFPPQYHGRAMFCNLHGHRVNQDQLQRRGSSFVASHAPDFVVANDPRFHAIHLKTGPDGSVFVLDWHDTRICHNSDPNVWDHEYGRIYKVICTQAEPARVSDLTKLSSAELVQMLRHQNAWWWRKALLLLDERADLSVAGELRRMVQHDANPTHSLRALWALFALEAMDESFARSTLAHSDAWVRSWAVRLLGENELSPATWRRLSELGHVETSADVRLQLACLCAAHKSDSKVFELLKILLARAEDTADPAIPQMLWIGLEPHVMSSPGPTLDWVAAAANRHSMVRDPITKWVFRRLAESGDPSLLSRAVGKLGHFEPSSPQLASALQGLLDGFQGQRMTPPATWALVAERLVGSHSSDVSQRARKLGAYFGDPSAVAALEQEVIDVELEPTRRVESIQSLALARQPSSSDALLQVTLSAGPIEIRRQALVGLGAYNDATIADTLLQQWPRLAAELRRDAIALMISRRETAVAVVAALEQGRLPRHMLRETDVRTMLQLEDPQLKQRIERTWGKLRQHTPAEIARTVAKLRRRLTAEPGDRAAGQIVYERNCGVCHRLAGTGYDVGPELTGANRRNPEYLLTNIVDPNRAVDRAYVTASVIDSSGKVHTGLLLQNTPERITLKQQNAKLAVIPRTEVEQFHLGEKSLMPDGLTNNLTEQQFSDLVAFLMEDLHLSRGWMSTPQYANQPLDFVFPIEQASQPLDAESGRWKPFKIGPAGQVDFHRRFADRYQRPLEGASYVYTEVNSPRSLDTTLVVGFRAGMKLWVNGSEVFRQKSSSTQSRISLPLRAGTNQLLFKISNIARNIDGPSAAGPSWLRARLVDPQRVLSLERPPLTAVESATGSGTK